MKGPEKSRVFGRSRAQAQRSRDACAPRRDAGRGAAHAWGLQPPDFTQPLFHCSQVLESAPFTYSLLLC